ncbi:MAG TPA: helicase-exonuclease AddAB subunit AddA [Verrucomicrobiae bacterium]|jgi:ATP-dependent helicase/nuclease subunit A|nr:helicase-exonuclease AddAB subunit AddA [Verrucomicrobiae bacterium]
MENLTQLQQLAVAARGNILVMAGAGTGKTHTLVARCLNLICEEKISLDEILMVTFTEAAAAEMKQRLRAALEKKSRENPDGPHCSGQLALFDTAHIGTLHSFCFKLVREHFHKLSLDPQISLLDEGESRLLADETLDEQFNLHYEGEDEFSVSVQDLIKIYGSGRDEKIRALVLRLHHHIQTRADADHWLTRQIEIFSAAEPTQWREWFSAAIFGWQKEWLPTLENLRTENPKAAECLKILGSAGVAPETLARRPAEQSTRDACAPVFQKILAADENWPRGKKTAWRKPFEDFFDDAKFLGSLAATGKKYPLAEDWNWIRGHMKTLLQLAHEFSEKFSARKRDDGVLDFHDLEQFALKLLWNFKTESPTPIAERWREKLRFIFVDEYQDINAAQDKIIAALSRDEWCGEAPDEPDFEKTKNGSRGRSPHHGNRFLVGDVKQSIYHFRLADPKIFRDYAKNWHGKNGQMIPLADNFRSRESLLNFVNSIFAPLMREEIGGVDYDVEAQLKFGSPEARVNFSAAKDSSPRMELLLRLKTRRNGAEADDESGANDLADLEESEKEARLLAARLAELKNSRHEIWDDEVKIFRAVEWRDMAILLRAPSGKAEIFAKQFDRVGIPLVVERGGFYDSSEILDLLGVLQLLDNPLQDVPVIAVLRSPLVGCSLDELAEIRLTASGHFWFALNQAQSPKSKVQNETHGKIEKFLERFHRWRRLAQQSSLSRCLEAILAETHYDDWLKSRPRGAQRHANVRRFLNLAEKFDQFQRQGLFRFLKFIEAQREIEAEPEVAPVAEENAVRLMSIHQSKGLEFPVVVLADLGKNFNEQDLRGEIIFDEEFGLCPRVQPSQTGGRYPSLSYWLAQKNQRRELRGEELRLLYVALTRARDHLILCGGISEKKWEAWQKPETITLQKILAAKSYADWLGLWFAQQSGASAGIRGELPNLRWRIADDAELAGEASAEKSKAKVELPELDDQTKQKLQEALTCQYEFVAATEHAAKSSVTALRRQATDELDDEAEPVFKFQFSTKRPARTLAPPSQNSRLNAADAGTAHHKFLQHVSLENIGELFALEIEAERLERERALSPDERGILDLKAVAAFWNSDAGRKIRKHTANVKRELPFTAKFVPKELDEILGAKSGANLENEFVVVQGVADLVVLLPKEIWLVDFKTDEIRTNELPEKIKMYSPQLKLYARALAKIYSRPVINCFLHFLSAQKTEGVKI